MAFQKEIASEHLPQKDPVDGSSKEDESVGFSSSDFRLMSEEELTEKLETILLERIKGGDNLALFQLGQLYYEQVIWLFVYLITTGSLAFIYFLTNVYLAKSVFLISVYAIFLTV